MRKIIPRSAVGQFLFFAGETAISYFVITANFRALAQGYYLATAVTGVLLTIQNCIVAKLSIEDADGRSWAAIAGSGFGGMIGSLSSIWVTKHLFGK
jgi:hypothetical protein